MIELNSVSNSIKKPPSSQLPGETNEKKINQLSYSTASDKDLVELIFGYLAG